MLLQQKTLNWKSERTIVNRNHSKTSHTRCLTADNSKSIQHWSVNSGRFPFKEKFKNCTKSNFGKEDKPRGASTNVWIFCTGHFRCIRFLSPSFRSMSCVRKTYNFPIFCKLTSTFPYHLFPFPNIQNFGLNGKHPAFWKINLYGSHWTETFHVIMISCPFLVECESRAVHKHVPNC